MPHVAKRTIIRVYAFVIVILIYATSYSLCYMVVKYDLLNKGRNAGLRVFETGS